MNKAMKKIKNSILFLVALIQSIVVQSQFIIGPGTLYGSTTTPMQKIGVGNFPANGDVLAKLHLNQFRLNANAATNGFLFRTDGDQSVVNRWQMFTGTSSTSQTERFRIRTFANGFDTWLERTQAGSEADIRLLTAQIELRARGTRLGDFCSIQNAPDLVQFGNITDQVNTFVHLIPDIPSQRERLAKTKRAKRNDLN